MRQHILKGSTLFSGLCWRMKFQKDEDDVLGPARAPEGRSHYGGQRALYLSCTQEGTVVATRRYMSDSDPQRAIYPLEVTDARIVDLRDDAATRLLGIDTTHRAAEWQLLRAQGLHSPTWDISDRVRALGLDGMLYASRSDPSKTHLTLFNWNKNVSAQVKRAGPAILWPQ